MFLANSQKSKGEKMKNKKKDLGKTFFVNLPATLGEGIGYVALGWALNKKKR